LLDLAADASPTTPPPAPQLYDWRRDEVGLDEVERIVI
jgi:hypothetical protein